LKDAVENVDLVLEAVPEVPDIKLKVFADLDSAADSASVLASNTSGLSITKLAGATKRPGKVVGMHWWNPPMIIPVIEIIRGEKTDDGTVGTVEALIKKIHKVPVLVKKDVPGFLGNRLQYALMREAIALLNDGVASAEDIDTMIKAGIGFKFPVMGPLETIDMAGMDIYHRVSQYLYANLNSDKTPPPLVNSMVEKNTLGLKTGKGFYDYSGTDINELMGGRIKKLITLLKELGYVK
jgi:3-hydroxyacyl-CoA dehydrogenase